MAEKRPCFYIISKSCSKQDSLQTVLICLFRLENKFFLESSFFVDSLLEHHCAHFLPKKVHVFALFRKVVPKSTVYRLSRFDFFGKKINFYGKQFFVNSLLEHHCAHFWPKKIDLFALFRKVAPKCTVYRLSRFEFFD